MLVLSRRVNESIVVGDKIIITLVESDYDSATVCFSIESPREYREVSREMDDVFDVCENVKIKIIDVHNSRAKVGIEAPKNIPVYRDEIYKKIKKANLL